MEGRDHVFAIAMSFLMIALLFLSLISVSSEALPDDGWQVAGPISFTKDNVCYNPQVCMDSTGDGMAVWQHYEGSRIDIFANHYIDGYGWEDAERIEFMDAGSGVDPQVASDGNGNFIAVWSHHDGVRENIWSNYYEKGIGWGLPEIAERDSSGRAINPQVVMDRSGNATAVWALHDGSRFNIWANRYEKHTGWETPELLETGNDGHALEPQVAVDSYGNVIAVWQQWDGTWNNIWTNRYADGMGWGTAELLESDDTGTSQSAQVSMGVKGNAFAVWEHQASGRFSIWSSNYSIGSGWGSPVLIESDDIGNAESPQIAVGMDGAVAVWYQYEVSRYNVYSNHYDEGSGWGTPELIESDDEGSTFQCQIATDGSGNYIAVWNQISGVTNNIWSNRYKPDIGWGREILIETVNSGECGHPQIAMDTSGKAIVVWEQFYDDVRLIASNTFIMPDTIPPVLDVESPPPGWETEWSEINIYGTTEPGVILTVNGYLAGVRNDGFFSCNVSLWNGNNTILVKAVDGCGNIAMHLTNVFYNDPVISLKKDMTRALEDIATLSMGISELELELTEMALTLAGLRHDLDINTINISQMEENLTVLRAEFEGLGSEVQAIWENFTTVGEQISFNEGDLDRAFSDIADLILELDSVSDALEDIEDDVQGQATTIEGLSSSLETLQNDTDDDIEGDLASTKDDLDSVRTVNTILTILIILLIVLLIVMFFYVASRTRKKEKEVFE